jgi:hypothetical protein
VWEDIRINKHHFVKIPAPQQNRYWQRRNFDFTAGGADIFHGAGRELFPYGNLGKDFRSLFQSVTPRTAGFNTVKFYYRSKTRRCF